MSDMSSFPIPPRDVSSIDGAKPAPGPNPKNQADLGQFKDELIQALGQIGHDADQMSQTSPSKVEDVESAMDQAKSAFDDTMQAHHLMQKLIPPMTDMNNETPPEEQE